MRTHNVNGVPPAGERLPTRRTVLGYAAAASIASLAPALPARSDDDPQPTGYQPWWVERFPARSTVIDARSTNVLRGGSVRSDALSKMLGTAIQHLTHTARTADAWRAILGDARQIVLKFNSVDAEQLKTNEVMAEVVIAGVLAADYQARAIALVECPRPGSVRESFRRPLAGWGASIPMGDDDRSEELANYVLEADAIVNVGFLKAHRLAGMSACMKNLAYAAIRRPARYHDNGCSPYIARVIGAEPIASRLRLNIVNALRAQVAHEGEKIREPFRDFGEVLVSFDPAAVDSVALSALSDLRRVDGIEPGLEVRYLAAAGQIGVGRVRQGEIERLVVENTG